VIAAFHKHLYVWTGLWIVGGGLAKRNQEKADGRGRGNWPLGLLFFRRSRTIENNLMEQIVDSLVVGDPDPFPQRQHEMQPSLVSWRTSE
jgi:hypothetical protein